ncbi:sigma-70 family RNA polymerase sigma factor [Magnetospirillum sp. ME-1]|uniref:sigma-70 family RNA polymerase sigma factor n=1 Tax=Magnetospirillum sp. ME-1 TaxID=1639348 RepID=UPI001F3023BD|nr:sigma-70 family RNA polymerase sigma factor [Magnetospirillum sp. ME-1]
MRAVVDGDPQAWERLARRIGDTVWTACRLLIPVEAEAREAFAEVIAALRADGFGRLRAYGGNSRIETFIALVARDILAQRLLRLFQAEDRDRAWAAFEAFFKSDIRRIVANRLPGPEREDMRNDAYQDICLALIAEDCRRLKAYTGAGSFSGFVLHAVDRLLIDFIRRHLPRRRLPAAIARLGPLDQAVFRYVHWERIAPQPAALLSMAARDFDPAPSPADIAQALERVAKALPDGYEPGVAGSAPVSLGDWGEARPDDGPTPEQAVLAAEETRLLTLASDALRSASKGLKNEERLYLMIALGHGQPLTAREVAHRMRRPVEEVYKLKQRVMARLRKAIEDHPAVKQWLASV